MVLQEVLTYDETEKGLIRNAYRQLLRSIKTEVTPEDHRNIRKAFELAVQAHSLQRRKSGEPYILHPIEVARICSEEIGLGPTAVIAALLHDVVEDTDVTLKEIHNIFGERIALLVNGLTKLENNYDVESPQAENFKKVLATLLQDVRVVLIKMADRLHNMRTLGSMPRHKQLKIAAETDYIYAPLAHRLGLYKIKTEFQDLCMKITHPTEYKQIARELAETKRVREQYIENFIQPIKIALNESEFKYRIAGRPKSIFSIWQKLKAKNVPISEIYDLFAVRIVLDVPPNKERNACWQAYAGVTEVYKSVAERLKDWINTPKANGYASLHTTVIGPQGRYVEVQIRTERMDDIAERGFAAHWKYKGVGNQTDVYEAWLDSVRDVIATNAGSSTVDFIENFRATSLFTEEVYVYTPKGDTKLLPKGATALDFAFSVHTDVGYRCQAVRVNDRLVPMGYELKNGDQVTVMTAKNQRPNEGWLELVTTGKARDRIRQALREEQKQAGAFGKEALERKLNRMDVDFNESVEFLSKHFGYKTPLDLYCAIAAQIVDLQDFKIFKVEKGRLIFPQIIVEEEVKGDAKTDNRKSVFKAGTAKAQLFIGGEPANLYVHHFSNCCNPVQGDDIFAYLGSGGAFKIHRTGCPNATNMMANYGFKIRRAEWGAATNATFVADLILTGIDGQGVIERLSRQISRELDLNMRTFYMKSLPHGGFEGRISIVVKNRDQLELSIRALKSLSDVSSVMRED
jgi:GTP diphosphokinase / guanosine-3',5'-bis(diphosphate) 3'-diphosphatase